MATINTTPILYIEHLFDIMSLQSNYPLFYANNETTNCSCHLRLADAGEES